MKNLVPKLSFIVLMFFLGACSSSYAPYAYDDVYYSPKNDPIQKIKKDPREDFNKSNNVYHDGSYPNRYNDNGENKNHPESLYQNRYANDEKARSNQEYYNNLNENNAEEYYEEDAYSQDEYYDEDYAQTLNQINSPVRSFSSYDPYTRDRIIYTANPIFISPSLYTSYQFWDPYYYGRPRSSLRFGWNSWSGWNIGFSYGLGYGSYGYSPYYYDPFYRPYYSPFYDPFYYSPYSYGGYGYGYGYGMSNYWAGYNHGFYNGYYGSGIGGNDYAGGSKEEGVRRINTPRGSSGSTEYGDRPTDGRVPRQAVPTTNDKSNISIDDNNNFRPERGGTILDDTRKESTQPSTAPNRNENLRPERGTTIEENARPKSTRPASNQPKNDAVRPERANPTRYQPNRVQEEYSRPTPNQNMNPNPSRNNSTAPARAPSAEPINNLNKSTPSRSTSPASRPSYSKPTYNTPSHSRPARKNSSPTQATPQSMPQSSPSMQSTPSRSIQSQPSMQRSRPSFNSPPSPSPSRSSGGTGGGAISRPARR